MRSYIRKSVALVLIISILLVFTFSTASAGPRVIYQTSTKETITSGAVLEKITRFTDDGWLNINVLRVDLKNPNIKVDAMSNQDSIRKLTSTEDLAESRGAVAAINGGFFSWSKDETGMANPVGIAVESGDILSADTEFNRYSNSMANMSITNLNQIIFDYWRTDITLVAPNGSTIRAARYNKAKPSPDFKDIIILDRSWGAKSIGTDTPSGCADALEMVVDNGKVVEIRQSQPAVQIPENGYVVVTKLNITSTTRNPAADFILNNYQPGDDVTFNITTTPDWSSLQTSISGGAMLLKDGQIPAKFSHMPDYTRAPRTAVGSSKDGTVLMLVTVDGRQDSSIGLNMTELAQLMSELGAYNALNLDGGGSTTMVARTPGTSDLDLVNSPSDGTQRRVTSAVGVFSIAPPSELDGLIIDTVDNNVFVNTSREYSIRGYDRYFNPISVSPDQVTWSVSGIQGSFKGGVFYPTSVGSGKIKATVGGVTAEVEVNSLSSPVQLTLSDKSLNLPLNRTVKLSVSGKNKNGYYGIINPDDVTWAVNGALGSFNKSTFTASGQGTGWIDASIGNTHAYCAVSVADERSTVKDSFETPNGGFTSYPSTVTGSYGISSEQSYSGLSSGKLSYDFSSPLDATRAAYFTFSNGGLTLEKNTSRIGLWVYNNVPNSSWLRGEVYDSNGSKYLMDFSKVLDWTGWKYVEMSLQGVKSPARLTKIYMVQVNPVADSGSIYMDDLTVTTSSYPPIDMSKVPQDTAPVDESNKSVTYKQASDSFRFSVFGQSREPKYLLEKLLAGKLADKANSYLEAAAVVGAGTHNVTKSITKPVIATNTGYKSLDMVNSRLIQLDMSKKGLRLSNSAQWYWFLQQLDSFKGNNVFIFLTDSPKTFSDSLEAKLFQDVLTKYRQETQRNVWVFYKDTKNTSYMERGVKYITTSGYEVNGLTPKTTDDVKYVLVTVKGSEVYFEFKPVI